MEDKKTFKPYIPASKVTPEMTVTSIIMGIILAVVFGAANAYLGLRVGMTVSASIPAAVIAMGVIRVIMRKNSILESNMVQTIGSAGESVAAGAIYLASKTEEGERRGKLIVEKIKSKLPCKKDEECCECCECDCEEAVEEACECEADCEAVEE